MSMNSVRICVSVFVFRRFHIGMVVERACIGALCQCIREFLYSKL